MKKLFLMIVMLFCFSVNMTIAADKYSADYLKNHKHFAVMNPMAESIAEHVIKSSLKAETGGKYTVKFEGYTLSSMKKGIFKSIDITGKNITVNNIPVPYMNIASLTDYNYVDYKQNPVVYKSDMTFKYNFLLTEESINAALKDSAYTKIIAKVNHIASKFFNINAVRTKIINNKLYIVIDYSFPFQKIVKERSFVTSADFTVINGKIKAANVHIDSLYGNLGLDKVANLINLLNPLEFTIDMLDNNDYKGIIENVNIVDNMVKVDGKIFVKGKV